MVNMYLLLILALAGEADGRELKLLGETVLGDIDPCLCIDDVRIVGSRDSPYRAAVVDALDAIDPEATASCRACKVKVSFIGRVCQSVYSLQRVTHGHTREYFSCRFSATGDERPIWLNIDEGCRIALEGGTCEKFQVYTYRNDASDSKGSLSLTALTPRLSSK